MGKKSAISETHGDPLRRPVTLKAFGAALRRQRETLGLTLDDLMAKTRISKPYLSNIETGRAPGPASQDKLRRIAKALHFPAAEVIAAGDWLRTPESVRRLVTDANASTPRRADGAIDLDAMVGKESRNADCEMPNAQEQIPDAQPTSPHPLIPHSAFRIPHSPPIPLRAVPLINRVAAGRAAEYTDLDYPAGVADQYVPVPDLPESPLTSAFALKVIGDSMMPDYAEGEILVVGPADEKEATPSRTARGGVKDGEDCVVRLGERDNFATTFKRIFFVKGESGQATAVRLVALNPKYPERVVKLEDVSGIYPLLYRMVPARLGRPAPPTP